MWTPPVMWHIRATVIKWNAFTIRHKNFKLICRTNSKEPNEIWIMWQVTARHSRLLQQTQLHEHKKNFSETTYMCTIWNVYSSARTTLNCIFFCSVSSPKMITAAFWQRKCIYWSLFYSKFLQESLWSRKNNFFKNVENERI